MVALESSFIKVLAQISINQVDITEGPEVKTLNTVGMYVAQGRLQIAKFVGGRGLEINIQSNDILKIQQICMESKISINAIEQNNILITLNKGEQKDFMNKLDNEGVKIQKSESVDKDLEEIYLNLTKR